MEEPWTLGYSNASMAEQRLFGLFPELLSPAAIATGPRLPAHGRGASTPRPGSRSARLWALPRGQRRGSGGRQPEGAGPGQGRAPASRPSPPLAAAPSLRLGAAGSALAGIPFLLPRCMVAAGAEEGEPGGARAGGGGESGAPARRSRLCPAAVSSSRVTRFNGCRPGSTWAWKSPRGPLCLRNWPFTPQ
ncbi:LHFPL tetraspan subfamily member 2 protein isoform X2 [Camarhynchus parvulus]|uniref:LHFPL tetraspan subfamily member 2 protein isoform X2 n=1 Tax=Geospiza parvula TaxID=87175 RepID=UPI001237F8F4|nr:LHFPL tetraspan subfamily member 2 protein isoform X2 [Camarhynchus parvulus]